MMENPDAIDALVDWEMTESPAAESERDSRRKFAFLGGWRYAYEVTGL